MAKLPVYSYDVDEEGKPTGRLCKTLIERPPEKKGQHAWVAACDSRGHEVFGYCELCGKKR